MKLTVDYNRCTGHGICEGIAEDLFEVQDEGWVVLTTTEPDNSRKTELEQAVAECPTRAITLTP